MRLSSNIVIAAQASTSSVVKMEEKTGKCKVSVREASRLIGAKLSRTHGHEFYEDTSHKGDRAGEKEMTEK